MQLTCPRPPGPRRPAARNSGGPPYAPAPSATATATATATGGAFIPADWTGPHPTQPAADSGAQTPEEPAA
ncbi:MAG TPA: hypothetical protein DEQ61_20310 [Streptomyces sp.]|nr:hypothetical protein [Streptomyces sp.]